MIPAACAGNHHCVLDLCIGTHKHSTASNMRCACCRLLQCNCMHVHRHHSFPLMQFVIKCAILNWSRAPYPHIPTCYWGSWVPNVLFSSQCGIYIHLCIEIWSVALSTIFLQTSSFGAFLLGLDDRELL